jgi:hypothetical protein
VGRVGAVLVVIATVALSACSVLPGADTGGKQPDRWAPVRPERFVKRALNEIAGPLGRKRLTRCTGYGPLLHYTGSRPGGNQEPAKRRDATPGRIKAIADRVESLRGRRFSRPVQVRFLAGKDIEYRYADPLLDTFQTPFFEAESRVLSTIGAAFSSIDLQRMSHRAISKGLLGLYLPNKKRLFVRGSRADHLNAEERFTLSHELNHALMDQVVGLPKTAPPRLDAILARMAVVEGDASLTMHRYAARDLRTKQQFVVLRDPPRPHGPTAELEVLPHYISKQGMFPYDEGLRFVCRLYLRGGWAAVDRAHDHPPESTAQVLFPDRYFLHEPPREADGLEALPRPWKLIEVQDFGAADLLWLFEAPSGDTSRSLSRPLRRASGWAGGERHLWFKHRETAVGMAFVQHAGAPNLCRSMRLWYRASFPGATPVRTRANEELAARGVVRSAVVWCSGDRIRIGIAPSLSLARRLVGTLAGGGAP